MFLPLKNEQVAVFNMHAPSQLGDGPITQDQMAKKPLLSLTTDARKYMAILPNIAIRPSA
jgi:hypothetical protein